MAQVIVGGELRERICARGFRVALMAEICTMPHARVLAPRRRDGRIAMDGLDRLVARTLEDPAQLTTASILSKARDPALTAVSR
jgi:hypothetical protein